MENMMEFLESADEVAVAIRLVIATLCGSLIGWERVIKRHSAGIKTFALVSLGSAVATALNIYLAMLPGLDADVSRIPAGVVSGIGFLGAGTILMRGNDNRVHGLTTAAGLWACACLGLAIGVGFYGAAITAGIIIFLSLTVFQRLGVKISNHFDQGEYEEEHTAYTQKRKARTASEDTGHRRHPRKTE